MNWKTISRRSWVIVPILVTGAVLVAASAPVRGDRGSWDHDDDATSKGCSDRTLRGDYGFALAGEVLGPGLKFNGVALQHYDGRGKITQVDHIVTNGLPPVQEWTPGTGTYSVNSNCTGSATLNVPGNPLSPINLHFVIVKDGREIHQVVDANAVTAVGNKVD
jgi:hypothetical protein